MRQLMLAITPELILIGTACVLFLMGISRQRGARRAGAWMALLSLIVVFAYMALGEERATPLADPSNSVHVARFAEYIKLLAAGVGVLLVLLAWPTNREATGNSAMDVGVDTSEFLALMLTSIAGVFLVAGANDIILLFLGIELASIPTYIMVSISRPLPAAQEAGVKYFFLGAMAAALMLLGFSYLYGTTGLLRIDQIAAALAPVPGQGSQGPTLNAWQQLAVVMLVGGFCFKMAAVPLHFYAGDVYQGAATPVTAFLSFVPKTSGVVAMIKLLLMATGGHWFGSPMLIRLLWIIAVLTMSVGNVLGLLQFNIKRVFAYSSIAHSGYMLVGLAALVGATDTSTQQSALEGVLFYLAAYGLMNAAAFGVLMLLPARPDLFTGVPVAGAAPTGSAETYEDLAGQGRRHPGLGLAMAVSCFSLIGLPLTVGFLGKFYLLRPALQAEMYWLVVATVINAAISAGYYLRIVGTMFLRAEPEAERGLETGERRAMLQGALPVLLAVVLSVAGTLLFGSIIPATQVLTNQTTAATTVQGTVTPAGQPVAQSVEP